MHGNWFVLQQCKNLQPRFRIYNSVSRTVRGRTRQQTEARLGEAIVDDDHSAYDLLTLA